MKKIIIGLVLLIPLLVIAALTVSAKIISVNAYFPVESVRLSNTATGEVLNDKTVYAEFSPENTNLNEIAFIAAEVLPRAVQNTDVEWTIEGEQLPSGAAKGYKVAEVDANGAVNLFGKGAFYLVATSKMDSNKYGQCFVVVGGNNVVDVAITYLGELADEVTMLLDGTIMLGASISPADAANRNLIWTSDNEKIVTVDSNGVVTSIASGMTTVRVTTVDGGYTDSIKVTVDSKRAFKGQYYTSSTEIPLGYITDSKEVSVQSGGGEIKDGILYTNGNEITLKISDAEAESGYKTAVITPCGEKEIAFDNFDLINSTFAPEGYLLRGTVFALRAVYKDDFNITKPKNIEYTVSDSSLASIDENGNVQIFGDSNLQSVTFTAVSGGESVSWTVNVIDTSSMLALQLNAVDDSKRGILGERVYGTQWLTGGIYSNEIEITIREPVDALLENYTFKVVNPDDMPDLAVFDEARPNVLKFKDVRFTDKRYVTVVVTAKYSHNPKSPLTAIYRFTVVDGVNIGTQKSSDTAADNARNISDLELLINARVTAVTHSNLSIPAKVSKYDLRSSIYGNGYDIESAQRDNTDRTNKGLFYIMRSGVIIENATLRHGYISGESDINVLDFAQTRFVVQVGAFTEQDDNPDAYSYVQYCIMENCGNGVDSSGGNIVIKGCIIRNAALAGVNAFNGYKCAGGNIVIENTVFSHQAGVAVNWMYNFDLNWLDSNEDKPWETVTPIQIKFKGFLDIYNWQNLKNLNLFTLPSGYGDESFVKLINSFIKSSTDSVLQTDEYSDLQYKIGDETYYHVAVTVLGVNLPAPDVISGYEESGFSKYMVKMPSAVAKFGFKYPLALYSYNKDKFVIGPDSVADYSDFAATAEMYENLRNGR